MQRETVGFNYGTPNRRRAASPEQEAMARQQGFRSYEEMILFERQRQMRRAPQTTGQPARDMNSERENHLNSAADQNFLQRIINGLRGG